MSFASALRGGTVLSRLWDTRLASRTFVPHATMATSVWEEKQAMRKQTRKALKETGNGDLQQQSADIADDLSHGE